jgi:hypothetical protein
MTTTARRQTLRAHGPAASRSLAAVLCAVLLLGCASLPPPTPAPPSITYPPPTGPVCDANLTDVGPPANYALVQSRDGTLGGCFRLGAVLPGPLDLALETVTSEMSAWNGPLSPTTTIKLSPALGPPGTTVYVSGYLPGGPLVRSTANLVGVDANVCWDGCLRGLMEVVPLSWNDPGHFNFSFRVPSVPWLGAEGPHPLKPGPYKVRLHCLAPIGCQSAANAEATFHLLGPASGLCFPAAPCAWLRFSPSFGEPGSLIQVQGWAPVTETVADLPPLGYWLVQAPAGARPGHSLVTVLPPGGGDVTRRIDLGASTFSVRAATA